MDTEAPQLATSVALVGGGIKGAVAAARCAMGDQLVLLHVNFGQPAWTAEAQAVRALARSLRSARVVSVDLPHPVQLEDQASADGGDPHAGQMCASGAIATDGTDSLPFSAITLAGLMPVLMSIGVQCAMRVGASRVVAGLSRLIGSAGVGLPMVEGQPQCRREFVHAFDLMIEALRARRSPVRIEAPLMDADYAEVVQLAFHFDVPVGELWTCERVGPRACGQCEPCVTRAQAFAEARLVDPLTKPRPAMAAPRQ